MHSVQRSSGEHWTGAIAALNKRKAAQHKTVLTYGTYDLFHVGHLRLFKRLKDLGDRLIVGVSTDEFNAVKGKRTIVPFPQRAEIIESLSCVDLVIAESSWSQKVDDIKKYGVDIFAMGDDWRGKFDDLEAYCEVRYLPRTACVSSTDVKHALESIHKLSPKELAIQYEILHRLLADLK